MEKLLNLTQIFYTTTPVSACPLLRIQALDEFAVEKTEKS
jgi:hypothetical protein